MPRKEDSEQITVSLSPEQFAVLQYIRGNKSVIVRQLIRQYMKDNNLPDFPPDAPSGREVANQNKKRKSQESS